mgnify:CR=1 FL=1
MKAKKDVDVNKLNQCQNELQKKELMIEELNTFVAEYNFEMDEIYIDSVKVYSDFMGRRTAKEEFCGTGISPGYSGSTGFDGIF